TERQVAELVAAGGTYREVADALFISPKTVQWNLSKIYRKLGIRSRAQLAASLTAVRDDGATPAGAPVPPQPPPRQNRPERRFRPLLHSGSVAARSRRGPRGATCVPPRHPVRDPRPADPRRAPGPGGAAARPQAEPAHAPRHGSTDQARPTA